MEAIHILGVPLFLQTFSRAPETHPLKPEPENLAFPGRFSGRIGPKILLLDRDIPGNFHTASRAAMA